MGGRFPKTLRIYVTKDDIEGSKCKDPTDCMIYHAVKRTIGGHGYVKVDARGVFITRRDDYREQATLPRSVYGKMLQFDEDKSSVRPFNFTLHFNLTTKIAKYTKEEIEKREERRRELRGQGKIKKYDPAKRYMGIAFSEKRA